MRPSASTRWLRAANAPSMVPSVRRVFDRGRSGASGPVVAYVFRRDDELAPRYALVVGKRWGNAVQRNRTLDVRIAPGHAKSSPGTVPDGSAAT